MMMTLTKSEAEILLFALRNLPPFADSATNFLLQTRLTLLKMELERREKDATAKPAGLPNA